MYGHVCKTCIFLGSVAGASSVEQIGPLSNVCYAVFALGSSAYPKFCNFGKTVDKILYELGGDRILEVACGDELLGQEQEFRQWSSKVFHVSEEYRGMYFSVFISAYLTS